MAEKTVLNVEGMTCSNCALGISRFLQKKGLEDVRVDFISGEVAFQENDRVSFTEIKNGIQSLGYKVVDQSEDDSTESKKIKSDPLTLKFIICLILTLPLLFHMIVHLHFLESPVFQLCIASPVFLIGLFYFGKSGWASLKTGIPNMDVLIVTGILASFTYSIAGMIMYGTNPGIENYLFFETSSTIVTLVLLGNLIEKRSVKQTTNALRELGELQPQLANKISIGKDLQELISTLPISSINKHDAILVNEGSVIPVDGKIYWGTAVVDESALTGESVPLAKTTNDEVMAGSQLVSGSIKIVTERTGSLTVLSNIIQLVKDAQQSKPAIQKLGDKIAGWFVPVVISISILTFLISHFAFNMPIQAALMHAIAVLVISCPCAMGLATPTAVAVGIGQAARNGILIKGGATLELFDAIKTVVLDKTGTLTNGKFKIASINCDQEIKQEVINLLVSMEQHSNHPIAKSILSELQKNTTGYFTFKNISEEKGIGINATDIDGNHYTAGSYHSAKNLTTEQNHAVYLSKNNKLIATVDLKDDLRNGAKELIQKLKADGITPVLLSGDSEFRCKEIANELGISSVYSNKLPHEKAEIIKQLKLNGTLLMVGDGINDAPSLALADLGISFSEATKIAVNSAQVVVLSSDNLTIIYKAIVIGKKTLLTIRQNLFWAFFYNIIAIPVAAIGLLSPMIAALSMAFSDVIVVGNSIRLKFKKF